MTKNKVQDLQRLIILFSVIIVVLILLLANGATNFKSSKTANFVGITPTPVSVDDSANILSQTPAPQKLKIYTNKTYNFQFSYPAELTLQENNNKIIFKDSLSRSGPIYLIYDANSGDSSNLEVWWKNNIKYDIDGGKVPDDYITGDNPPDSGCFMWTTKPSSILDVSEKNSEISANSIYVYFNFGKPFIIDYESRSTGACSGNVYISTMKPLAN